MVLAATSTMCDGNNGTGSSARFVGMVGQSGGEMSVDGAVGDATVLVGLDREALFSLRQATLMLLGTIEDSLGLPRSVQSKRARRLRSG